MTQGEIPGTTWLGPARWYSTGRDGCQVAFVVIHYTAGAEGRTAAESGAAYDKRRPDQVSTHFFADSDSVVQEVKLADRAYAAFGNGNRLGVQMEICGTLQTYAQWLDPVSAATLANAARATAELCKRFGLEARRLTHDEMRRAWSARGKGAIARGIVGHVDCTVAYGQGDHTDPGPQFPWDYFLGLVREHLNQSAPTQDQGVDDMIVAQLNQPNGKGGVDSSWWATDTLRAKQLTYWEGFGGVLWHCTRYGQATPYDHQCSDLAQFWAGAGRVDVDVDPSALNIAPAGKPGGPI